MITFMPCNKRVEDQALGRKARQGKNETGEIIINKKTYHQNMRQKQKAFMKLSRCFRIN